jgi:Uma2 family endonuclease
MVKASFLPASFRRVSAMSVTTSLPAAQPLVYPESDGKPMADNTLQFEYITTIKGGLEAQYKDNPDVFVAGDLLWYPVEGEPRICMAPDTMVAFGRRKGYRGCYKQWEEGNIAPQVVFEIWSPNNRLGEMARKFDFYQRYHVEEYYVFDPDNGELEGWQRQGDRLLDIPQMQGWISPRINIRFEVVGNELRLYHPDGRRFASYVELVEQRDQQQQRAEQERQRAERLQAQLKALGIPPEA